MYSFYSNSYDSKFYGELLLDDCVEIADINEPQEGWTDYDPTQGASSDELTEICNSLYDRCLLAELGIKGFTPANEHKLIKS